MSPLASPESAAATSSCISRGLGTWSPARKQTERSDTMHTPPKSMWTMPAIVKMQAERLGARPFCTFADGQSFTFKGLDDETGALASGLADLGVGPGDRVSVMVNNSKAFLGIMVAVHKRG